MTPWPDSERAREQYQALRREALENASRGVRGHGLSLFLTRGMAAWLSALSLLVPQLVERPSTGMLCEFATLPSGARSDMTRVLARMVMAVGWEKL